MQWQMIHREQALGPGAELWIMADLDHSAWTWRVDWHLGFQLDRARRYQMSHLSESLKEVVQETEFILPQLPSVEKNRLMVMANPQLPTRMVVQIDFSSKETVEDWVNHGSEIWKSLGQPKVRVFLPKTVSASILKKKWSTAVNGEFVEE